MYRRSRRQKPPFLQEKAYPCPYEGCDKACVEKPTLRNHLINNHIKTRPYVCQIQDSSCGGTTSYNDPSNLSAHYRKRHGTKLPIPAARLVDCVAAVENPDERAWHISVISKSALASMLEEK